MRVPEQLSGMPIIQYGVDRGGTELGSSHQRRFVAICRCDDPAGYVVHLCDGEWRVTSADFFPQYEPAAQRAVELSESSFDWQFPDLSVWNWIMGAERLMYVALFVLLVGGLALMVPKHSPWTFLLVPEFIDSPSAIKAVGVVIALAYILLWIAIVAIWVLVGYFGLRVGGWKYGIGHLLIVIVFTPTLLLGPILVPRLMLRDVIRWREADEKQRCGSNTEGPGAPVH